MTSIRDNSMRVNYLGFRVTHSTALVYIFSTAFAGIAGSMSALFQNLVSPYGYVDVAHSFLPILATIIGGASSFMGQILGAAIFSILEEVTTMFTQRVELVNGIVLLLVIMYFPSGFIGLLRLIKTKFFKGKDLTDTLEGAS